MAADANSQVGVCTNNQNVRVEKQSGVDTTKGRLLLLRSQILRNGLFKAVWCVWFKQNTVRRFV